MNQPINKPYYKHQNNLVMKKSLFIVLLLAAFGFSLPAQNNEMVQLQNRVVQLENANTKLTIQLRNNQKNINDLTKQVNVSGENIKQLQADLTQAKADLQKVTNDFGTRIQQTELTSSQRMDNLGKSISHSTLYWIIAFIIIAGLSYLLFGQLKGKLAKVKNAISENIKSVADQLKQELTGSMNKNNDDLKQMLTNDLNQSNDNLRSDLTHNFQKTNEGLREELTISIKKVTDTFNDQKEKLETELKVLQQEVQKAKASAKP